MTEADTPEITPIRILIVDDHADTNMVMKLLLERRGFTVVTADSVRTALEALDSGEFNLLVSDIGLPDGSGLDIVREFSQRHTAPAIALSGFGMEEDVQRSMDGGFHAHLVKPVSFQTLHETIQQLLQQQSKP